MFSFFQKLYHQFSEDYCPDRDFALPDFPPGDPVRFHLRFSGSIQHVGFRIEFSSMAERLGLTGWVRNLNEGDVEAEVQGTLERIDYLLSYMGSLRRLSIRETIREERPLRRGEEGFRIYY